MTHNRCTLLMVKSCFLPLARGCVWEAMPARRVLHFKPTLLGVSPQELLNYVSQEDGLKSVFPSKPVLGTVSSGFYSVLRRLVTSNLH